MATSTRFTEAVIASGSSSTKWRPPRLRVQLAAGHAVAAVALVVVSNALLAARSDALRLTEALTGVESDAELLAAQVAQLRATPGPLEELVKSPTPQGARRIEIWNDGVRVAGVDWVSTDPARADFVRAATLSAESGASRTFGNEVVGVARQLSVPGAPVVIVAEPRPPRRLWHDIFFGLNLPLAAAFGLGSALLGWWVAGLVTRPIDALAAHARAVALRSDVPPPLESAIPEVATLTAAVDRLGRRVEADSEERARISAALRRVSHEMRTPLTTLRLRVDDLAELPGASPNTVQVIEGQIDRLERLGDTLSELRTRGADAEMAAISLQVPVAAVVSRVAPLARWGQIDLRTEQLGSVQVMGDRVLLEDAVSNLVENALKHTPRGGRVRIAVGRTGDGSPMIEVTDSGPGFTTAMAHVGSQPAVRAVSAASGSGQGLAIVADTMDRHGGRLELGEAPGGGALVRLVFRADSAETHIGR